jgi:putative intracellular protease/amidase
MTRFKQRTFRWVLLLLVPFSLAVVVTRTKSAAEVPMSPCRENETARVADAKSATAAIPKVAVRNVAIFIFDGVQIIDYTGPFEVLGQAHDGEKKIFNVYTVAEKSDAITTNMGMTVVPKYSFADMPRTDVLVLPGGNVSPGLEKTNVIKWVQETSANAEFVMSVCNGAFYLGKAGLLDGLTATTFYGLIDPLKTLAPKARIVSDQRFVDNGKIVTTAGLSSGIDGALHLIEKIVGRGRAQEVALNLEYNWQPDSGYARASFADIHMRKVLGREGFKLPEGTAWTVLGQRGNQNEWEKNWQVQLDGGAPELLKIVDTKLAEGWTKVSTSTAAGEAKTIWKFTDEAGKQWTASSAVEPAKGAPKDLHLRITLARAETASK